MSVVSKYKNEPVQVRIGVGVYTYKCVLDTEETGIIKIEIFAGSPELAIICAAQQFNGVVVSWSYISPDIISIILAPYNNGTCLLYL